jgi:hypothetical protein
MSPLEYEQVMCMVVPFVWLCVIFRATSMRFEQALDGVTSRTQHAHTIGV